MRLKTLRYKWVVACLWHFLVWGFALPLAAAPAAEGDGGEGSPTPRPKVRVRERAYQFGEVKEGTTVSHVFVLENAGDAELLIQRVKPG